jgi:hypothetical protein
MPNARKKSGYSKKDLREVSDNPELTKADFAKARPFSEVFPDPEESAIARVSKDGARGNLSSSFRGGAKRRARNP